MSNLLELARELVKQLEEQENCYSENLKDEKVELSTLNPGEIFMIGEHEFKVLEQNEEAGETSVISTGIMAKNVEFGNSRDYTKSNLRKVIEGEIQPIIKKEVGADNIVTHEVDLTSIDMQNEFGKLECKVRPITFDEARKYNDLISDNELDVWWWTCTPWSTEKRGSKYLVTVVSPRGYVNYDDYNFHYGVRPFCILKSNIFVSKGV